MKRDCALGRQGVQGGRKFKRMSIAGSIPGSFPREPAKHKKRKGYFRTMKLGKKCARRDCTICSTRAVAADLGIKPDNELNPAFALLRSKICVHA